MAQNPTRQVHALLGGFAQDAPIENQNHRKTDKIIARTFFFSKNQKPWLAETLAKILTLFLPSYLLKKKTNLLWPKQLPSERIFYADRYFCWKSAAFTFTKTFAKKRQADFENLLNQPRTKPRPRNKANQNHCKPKRQQKTLRPILATLQNQLELMPKKKT